MADATCGGTSEASSAQTSTDKARLTVHQRGQFGFSVASASTKVAQFPQHLPSFVHQFPKFCLDVGSTSFVLRTAQTVVFGTLAHVFFLGTRRIEFHVADVDLLLNADEVGLSACVPFAARCISYRPTCIQRALSALGRFGVRCL